MARKSIRITNSIIFDVLAAYKTPLSAIAGAPPSARLGDLRASRSIGSIGSNSSCVVPSRQRDFEAQQVAAVRFAWSTDGWPRAGGSSQTLEDALRDTVQPARVQWA
jgi:hypothetical protein